MDVPPLSSARLDVLLGQIADEFSHRLRRKEAVTVEEYVARYPELSGVLRRILPALSSSHESGQGTVAGPLPPGGASGDARRLGDFRILREVGRGGMGIVYEAEQISLSRRVALKVLPFAGALEARQLARFRNEAQAAAQLHHTNIVPVYAVGCDRNVHYYAMQFIDGDTLASAIAALRGDCRPDGTQKGFVIQFSGTGHGDPQAATRIVHSATPAAADRSRALPAASGPADPPSASRHDPGNNVPADTSRTGVAGAQESPAQWSLIVSGDEPSGAPLAGGPPFIAPAALPALSTDHASNRGEFFRTLARLGIQAAEALDYAHQRGVVHRDIKPANLLLDTRGNLWITDFGLARMDQEAQLTTTGDMLGTLRYMSPEQTLSRRPLIDHRTDIYSLGLTLYELITLRPAMDGADRQEILRQIAEAEPRPPRDIERKLPVELETIVLKAIEKEPADRYATAQDLADDLRRFLEHRPILAQRPTAWDHLKKFVRRHRQAVLATTAVLILAAIGISVAGWMLAREQARTAIERESAEEHRRLALMQTRIADEQRQRALALQQAIRWSQYVTNINLAEQSWSRNDFAATRQHLDDCLPGPQERDLRGFEWRLLNNWCRREPSAWGQHTGQAYFARFSPDGRLLATCGQDGVLIWDWARSGAASKGALMASLTGHTGDVNGAGWSPDGKRLATAGDDKSVRIWNAATWREEVAIPHGGAVVAAEFSPDGTLLATAERDNGPSEVSGFHGENVVRLWDAATWRLLGELRGHSSTLQGMTFSRDGSLLGTVGKDHLALVWDVATREIRHRFVNPQSINCLAFAGDRALLAAGGDDGRVRIWSLTDDARMETLSGHNSGVESIAFAPGGQWFVSASRDGMLRLWQVGGHGPQSFTSHDYRSAEALWGATIAPDGESIVTTGFNGAVKTWRRGSPQEHDRVVNTGVTARSRVSFSADSGTIALAGRAALLVSARSRAVATGAPATRSLPHGDSDHANVLFAREKGVLVTGSSTGVFGRWHEPGGNFELLPERIDAPIEALIDFPDTGRLLALARGETLLVDPATGRGETLPAFKGARWMEVRHGGRQLLSLNDAQLANLQVHNWPPGEISAAPGTTRYDAATWSHDGQILAVGGNDGTIRLWQGRGWNNGAAFAGGAAWVVALAFSPDDETLAGQFRDGSLRLWNVATGRELMTLQASPQSDVQLLFSPDGTMLASAAQLDATAEIPERHVELLLWNAPEQLQADR